MTRAQQLPQRGFSLVSMMVGVLISLLITLAISQFFVKINQTSLDARIDARRDGELSTGLQGAGIVLQEAGFGLDAQASSDLLLIDGAALSAQGALSGTVRQTGEGNALLWRFVRDGETRCSGVIAPASGGLQLLRPQACSALTNWNTATWQKATLASAVRKGGQNAEAIRISLSSVAACQALGLAGQGRFLATLSGAASINGASLKHSVCLANFTSETT